jgi:PAS domain S-box-containing protein
VSKAYVDNILHSMSDMLIVVDACGNIQRLNPAAARQLGYGEEELLSRPLSDLIVPPERELFENAKSGAALIGTRSLHLQSQNGDAIPVLFTAAEIRSAQGRLEGLVCNAVNMTERLAAENQLRASLQEKEVLLKEVHHRVKNNLQIICSLFSLQSREANDPQIAHLFADTQGRIRSMALIHEQLYQSAELARIDFAEYSRQLCQHLIYSSGWQSDSLAVRLDVDRVPLELDIAIPCGMILNELISNAMKHAFPQGETGEVCVAFRSEDNCRRLTVRDNGIGLAPVAIQQQQRTLGLTLVEALVRQLKGRMSIDSNGGTQVTIEFPSETALERNGLESNGFAADKNMVEDQLNA